jgi:DNA-binding CsgD family transcriptional regulator
VLVNVPRREWCFPVREMRQLIGRCDEAAIRVPDAYLSVSRRHAEIWSDSQGYWLCDLGSHGGTRVNGIWLRQNEPSIIVTGDRLTFGRAELRLEPGPVLNDSTSVDEGHQSMSIGASTLNISATPPLETRSALEELTFSEHNIVLWMGRGYFNDKELGELLHRSPHTVRTQVANILKKLNLSSRASIITRIQRDGTALRVSWANRDSRLP